MIFAPPGGPPVELIIAIVGVLAGTVLLWPLVRAWARRLERGAANPALSEELDQVRARLAEMDGLQQRMMELEDRVDFSERVMAQRSPEQLEPGVES